MTGLPLSRNSGAAMRRGYNDIAQDILDAAPQVEPLIEEWFETMATGTVLGALMRIRAACNSDADLAKLPALRDFLLRETAVVPLPDDHNQAGRP